jgi:hypothetical protein
MQLYLLDLVKRLSNFSERLDNKTLFVDKIWVLVDEKGNHQTFIFERDGNLIMSINGVVTDGSWRYITEAKSILIKRGVDDKILLNHAFLDTAVMILKYDGTSNDNLFILADKNVVTDLNIEKYLKSRLIGLFKLKVFTLSNGQKLEVYTDDYGNVTTGSEVLIDCCNSINSVVETPNMKFYIKDSKILKKRFLIKRTLTNSTEIIIEQYYLSHHTPGDLVFIDGNPAPSGKYKLGFLNYLRIVDGSIV